MEHMILKNMISYFWLTITNQQYFLKFWYVWIWYIKRNFCPDPSLHPSFTLYHFGDHLSNKSDFNLIEVKKKIHIILATHVNFEILEIVSVNRKVNNTI